MLSVPRDSSGAETIRRIAEKEGRTIITKVEGSEVSASGASRSTRKCDHRLLGALDLFDVHCHCAL
jgi:hypothetical protein